MCSKPKHLLLFFFYQIENISIIFKYFYYLPNIFSSLSVFLKNSVSCRVPINKVNNAQNTANGASNLYTPITDVSAPIPRDRADIKGVFVPKDDSWDILDSQCHKPRRNIGLNARLYKSLQRKNIHLIIKKVEI